MASVGIIGGGPAGLGLAFRLTEQGHKVTLFEASDSLGGLARSFHLGSVSIERYYHFICADDSGYFEYAKSLGIDSKIQWAYTHMGFFYDGTLYPMSSGLDLLRCGALSLQGRLRYAALALRCSLTSNWQHLDGIPAKEWLIEALGVETYRIMWHPLLEVKFHDFHDKISAAWVWHRIHRVARSRDKFQRERLGYLAGNTQVLVDALVKSSQERGARLLTSSPVKRIVHDGARCSGLETMDGEFHGFDHVVSASPLPVFLQMTPDLPARYRANLDSIEFIGVICVILRLKMSISPNYWVNINDPRIPFNGIIEYTNLNPEVTGDGTTIVYAPYYLPRTHERWGYSDEKHIADAIAALVLMNRNFSANEVVDAAVSRDPYAQVICSTGFRLRTSGHRTPIDRLFLIESSQLYPSDRTVSGTLDLSSAVARMIGST